MPNSITTVTPIPSVNVNARRVYVASKFQQYERARNLMDDLTEAGYDITHDWTRTEQFGPDGHPRFKSEQELPKEDRRNYAIADLRGVRTADLVVFLADQSSFGAPVEVGHAFAFGVEVFVVEPLVYTVFWDLPLVTMFESEEQARLVLGASA